MRYKIFALLFLLLMFPYDAHAEGTNVTIVYSSQSMDVPPEVYKLDALISRFSEDIKLLKDTEVTSRSFLETSHLFYFGVTPGTLPDRTRALINQTDIPFYAMGYNVDQFEVFTDLETARVVGAATFHQQRTGNTTTFDLADTVLAVKSNAPVVHASLLQRGTTLPIIMQKDRHFYSGIYNLLNRSSLYVADSLFDFFRVKADTTHQGYLRLEDINPSSDPDLVEEVGNYLLDRDIPILLAVIPVYRDPESGQNIHFSDRPKLLEVVRQLEERGATVLSHGYTHQYRTSETGEGFEFWDVENNQPVLVPSDETPPILKTREAFSNDMAYNAYRDRLLEGEASYIRSKLTKSINELVSLRLHPLGFEAPHYTMSHSGYALAAEQFSNLFGQVQWSNTNWEVMGTTPYVSKPSLLNGMTLYPETIGYVRTDLPRPVEAMRQSRDEIIMVRESMIGGFYHPYIGTEHLADLVDMMEATPGFHWLDLKAQTEWVRSDDVFITSVDGTITLKDERSMLISLSTYLPQSFLERALVLLSIITLLAVMTFFLYTLYLRTQRKKRLFKERF